MSKIPEKVIIKIMFHMKLYQKYIIYHQNQKNLGKPIPKF